MEALAALERRRPDLVILDIMMPGLDGGDVLARIESSPQLASIPVIMLTAKSADQDLIDSYKSGADYYITKPLVARQLLHGIGLVLGFREVPVPPPTAPEGGTRGRPQRSSR